MKRNTDLELYEYPEDDQLQYLNELQQIANVASIREPELVPDMLDQINVVAAQVGMTVNHVLKYDGKEWQ